MKGSIPNNSLIFQPNEQTLLGSFSSVSTPNFHIRWKALDEIYKIYMLLHRSDLNISKNFRQALSAKFAKLVIFEFFSLSFAQILMKFCMNFADALETVDNFRNF